MALPSLVILPRLVRTFSRGKKKKKYTVDSEKLRESVKGRRDYRSEVTISLDRIFYFCYQFLRNGLVSFMIKVIT